MVRRLAPLLVLALSACSVVDTCVGSVRPCDRDDACDLDEACIDGRCAPVPGEGEGEEGEGEEGEGEEGEGEEGEGEEGEGEEGEGEGEGGEGEGEPVVGVFDEWGFDEPNFNVLEQCLMIRVGAEHGKLGDINCNRLGPSACLLSGAAPVDCLVVDGVTDLDIAVCPGVDRDTCAQRGLVLAPIGDAATATRVASTAAVVDEFAGLVYVDGSDVVDEGVFVRAYDGATIAPPVVGRFRAGVVVGASREQCVAVTRHGLIVDDCSVRRPTLHRVGAGCGPAPPHGILDVCFDPAPAPLDTGAELTSLALDVEARDLDSATGFWVGARVTAGVPRWTSGAPLTAVAADAPLDTWGFFEPNGLIGGDEDVMAYSVGQDALVDLPAGEATHVACATADAISCEFVDDGLFVCARGGCATLAMPRSSSHAALRAFAQTRAISTIELGAIDSAREGDWVFGVDGFVPLPIVGAWAPGQAAYDSTPKCLALAPEGLTAVACTTSRPALCEVNGAENVQGCVRAGSLWFCGANRGFSSATSFCANRGGRLAQLTSVGAFADAEGAVETSAAGVWVGGSNDDGGEFTWLDGAAISALLSPSAP